VASDPAADLVVASDPAADQAAVSDPAADLAVVVSVLAAGLAAVSDLAAGPVVVSGPAADPAVVSGLADSAEHQASGGIAVPFDALVPASVAVAGADSPGRPTFLVFPNVDYPASPSSCVQVAGWESVHSSIGARTNCGLCSALSNPGLRQNRNLEHCCNSSNPGHNMASDTNGLPTDATRSHSRKIVLRRHQEQRTHCPYQASRSRPVAPEMRSAVDHRRLRTRRVAEEHTQHHRAP
jgi:hypothetical protein